MIRTLSVPWCSRRLLLRPFEWDDAGESYLSTLRSATHMRFSRQKNIDHNLETVESYIRSLRSSGGEMISGIHRQSGRLSVTVTARRAETPATLDLGIMTLLDFVGRGIGLEAWRSTVGQLRQSDEFRVVTAGTQTGNWPMRSILVKSGFSLVDTCPDAQGTAIASDGVVRYRLELRE